jgi:predicted small lipoprotein YifL
MKLLAICALLSLAACGETGQPSGPQAEGAAAVDSDGDGVLDSADQCPSTPRGALPDLARNGCPAADADGDSIQDPVDICPGTPAGANPDPSRRGCPAAVAYNSSSGDPATFQTSGSVSYSGGSFAAVAADRPAFVLIPFDVADPSRSNTVDRVVVRVSSNLSAPGAAGCGPYQDSSGGSCVSRNIFGGAVGPDSATVIAEGGPAQLAPFDGVYVPQIPAFWPVFAVPAGATRFFLRVGINGSAVATISATLRITANAIR